MPPDSHISVSAYGKYCNLVMTLFHVHVFRLASVRDLVLGRQLMCVLLKLFSYAVNVKVNRQELIRPDLNTVNIMLGALNLVGTLDGVIVVVCLCVCVRVHVWVCMRMCVCMRACVCMCNLRMLLCVQALWAEPEGGPAAKGQTITEQVLNILEVILLEASEQPPEQYSVSLSASWC